MSGVQPPPGWYPDHHNPFRVRFWDGSAWTEHTRLPPVAPAPVAAGPPRPTGRGFGHGLLTGVLATAVAGVACLLLVAAALAVGTGSDGDSRPAASEPQDEARTEAEKSEPATRAPGRKREGRSDRKQGGDAAAGKHLRDQVRAGPRPRSRPVPKQRSYRVVRVVDGDTVELGNGQTVRLVGIDTPEVGECGYDRAAVALGRLVTGRQVRLVRSEEDRDHYGRLLRYVDVGSTDAGLSLIRSGLAIARYDSRDGYGFHPREPRYIAADQGSRPVACPKPAPAPQPLVGGGGACAPGYSPCVPPYSPDVDCADVAGPITVTGSDPHGLDADGDGVACE